MHHHRTKPIMEHENVLAEVGRSTQLAVRPVLTVTTQAAVDALKPRERDCYADGEAQLR